MPHPQVHNTCFFKGHKQVPSGPGACLIANPPYVPAPDNDILMPALWGGVDGAVLTRELLTLGFDRCMLLISGGRCARGQGSYRQELQWFASMTTLVQGYQSSLEVVDCLLNCMVGASTVTRPSRCQPRTSILTPSCLSSSTLPTPPSQPLQPTATPSSPCSTPPSRVTW